MNVIPDRVQLQVDIRTLPGWDRAEVEAMIDDALGDLAADVEITWHSTDVATTSPTDTPLWDALERVARRVVPRRPVRALPHRGGHRRPLLPAHGHRRLRVRALQRAPLVRAVRVHVPRRRRAGRRGVARPVGRSCGTAWPGSRCGERAGARPAPRPAPTARCCFDFGGVLTDSPFDAFDRYERAQGLPEGFIRTLNATNHLDNAWARLERNELDFDGFCDAFEAEARRPAAGSTPGSCSPRSPASSGPR